MRPRLHSIIRIEAMMPRYGTDTAGTCHRHGKDTDFIHKKWSIGYDKTRYAAHYEASAHHRIEEVKSESMS